MYINGLRWRVGVEWWELANSGCGVGETIANSNDCVRNPKNALHESFQSFFWCCECPTQLSEWPSYNREWPSYNREWPSYCNYSLTKFRNAMSKCKDLRCASLSVLTSSIFPLTSSISHQPSHPSPYLAVWWYITRLVKGFVAHDSCHYNNKNSSLYPSWWGGAIASCYQILVSIKRKTDGF